MVKHQLGKVGTQEHHASVSGPSRISEAVFPSLLDDPQASNIGNPLSISLIHRAE